MEITFCDQEYDVSEGREKLCQEQMYLSRSVIRSAEM
jgi:hypothetical protein